MDQQDDHNSIAKSVQCQAPSTQQGPDEQSHHECSGQDLKLEVNPTGFLDDRGVAMETVRMAYERGIPVDQLIPDASPSERRLAQDAEEDFSHEDDLHYHSIAATEERERQRNNPYDPDDFDTYQEYRETMMDEGYGHLLDDE